MINKTLLQKRFNRAAVSYDQYANVQKKMARHLLSQLEKRYSKAAAIRILELGCGTGYITEKLVHLFPNAQITAIDFAESMIAVAKQRRHVDEVTFRCEDIEKLILDDFYDVIISNATFQWLNDLEVSLVKLYKHLAGEGILLFSTFGNRTFQELHRAFERAKEEKNIKSHVSIGQRLFTKAQLQNICSIKKGNVHVSETCYIEKFTHIRDFFKSIRKVGATNSNEDTYCQSPSLFRAMLRIYERDFTKEGEIIATYHALFAHIEKEGKRRNETNTNKSRLEENCV
ncbi:MULTISPECIES: malonyl-ACP O-methyltransferase BioC [Bacillus cereus group]|uniref:Malonyl-[acyl-carrier protein] O-methyltransferase n=1 Tax=Bacillus cytotoxicus TaxID=580165 RepID=A0AAX2CK57_9BACI|nr:MULTISPECIES: malonyl-ACP O-methyltransferase BioC [Bacillus cereus group]QTR70143.1 malonyl-ACP O-methyltransferase BioC [Bacillus cytotoxicus]QTR78898.1 malonyl-ACP O-methyltransferase BioC [Bacillus cytotoxicus]QTR84984.1 malonyl-ACP O-methyltransferase BioC [Bacillus cytotoxicus]QTR88786.1 malonyl-ACP O-methyltransferase BioC [Bacillus cytotoxicus]SCL99403.1 Malonyl-[acyl-carrier protein] O-methyltransferase [Bacillus cytotoxicus]